MTVPTKFRVGDMVHLIGPETGAVYWALGIVTTMTSRTLNWVQWDDGESGWWNDDNLVKADVIGPPAETMAALGLDSLDEVWQRVSAGTLGRSRRNEDDPWTIFRREVES